MSIVIFEVSISHKESIDTDTPTGKFMLTVFAALSQLEREQLKQRQLVCFSIAATTAVPTYFLTKGAIGNTAAMLLLIVVAMPSFLAAMYEKNGQPFEKVVKIVVKSRFIRPKIRPYKTENVYEYAVKQADLEKEIKEIINN